MNKLWVIFFLASVITLPYTATGSRGNKQSSSSVLSFHPVFYWGVGGGFNVIRFRNPDSLCPVSYEGYRQDCINYPVGGGIKIFGGMRPHPHFALDLAWDSFIYPRSDIYSRATIQSFHLDLKVYPFPACKIQPYFGAGGGLYWFGDSYSWERGGGGFLIGGGFDVLWFPGFSSGALIFYRGIYFWERVISSSQKFPATFAGNLEVVLNLIFRYNII